MLGFSFFFFLLPFFSLLFFFLVRAKRSLFFCVQLEETQNIMTSFRRQWPLFHRLLLPPFQSTITHITSHSIHLPLSYFSFYLSFFPLFDLRVEMWILFLFLPFFFEFVFHPCHYESFSVLVRFWKCHFLLSLSTAAHFSYKGIYIILTEFMNISFW